MIIYRSWLFVSVLGLLGFPFADASANDAGENPFGVRVGLLRLELASIYDSNIDHDVVPQEDYGVDAGIMVRLQTHADRPTGWLEYKGGVQSYANTDQWDRLRHRLRLGLENSLGSRVQLSTRGDLNTRTSTEDRELVNQFTVSPELTYKGDGGRRLRLFGAYRLKRFTEQPDRDETIWYAGVKARGGLSARGKLEIEYRYENAASETPAESYTRHRVGAEYEQKFGRWDRLSLDLTYRLRDYPEDYVEDLGGDVFRRDRRWNSAAKWTHRLREGQQLELEYEFQSRSSNDVEKTFHAHQIVFGVRWPLIR